MKRIAIGVFLTLKLTLCWGQSDSLKLYEVPKYKLDKLLHAYFYKLPICDTLTVKQDSTISALKFALQSSKEVIEVKDLMIENKSMEVTVLRNKAENLALIAASEKKQVKKKSFKRGFIIGVALGLIALVI